MKDISLGDFKKMKVAEIKDMGCFRVTSDGEFAFLVINPPSAFKRDQFEALMTQCNQAMGK